MEPGHKSHGFGRQNTDLTCIWSASVGRVVVAVGGGWAK